MRAYQTKTNLGGAADSIVTTKYGGGEISSLNKEGENAVSTTGQTVANSAGASEKFNQLAQASFIYGTGSQTMQDSGIADAYIVTPVTGTSGLVVPDAYANMNGTMISFIPSAIPTGASTLDFGQTTGTLLGTKKILTLAGAALSAAAFDTTLYHEFRYDTAADAATGAWIFIGKKSTTSDLTAFYTAYGKWSDVKAINVEGGTFTSGAWRVRDLNNEDSDTDNIGSVAANQLTLDAGTYICFASAPAEASDRHKLRLWDDTGSAELLLGQNARCGSAALDNYSATLSGKFTIGVQSVLELQHQCGTSSGTGSGFGSESNFTGASEVYAVIELWRVA